MTSVAGHEVGNDVRKLTGRAARAIEQVVAALGLPGRRSKISPQPLDLAGCLEAGEARYLRAFIGAELVVRLKNGRRLRMVNGRGCVSLSELHRAA